MFTHHSPGPQSRSRWGRARTSRRDTQLCRVCEKDRTTTTQQPPPLPQQQGSEHSAQHPPTCPKIALQNDQLPELGATGRNRKIRRNRWLLNASTRRKRNDCRIVTCGIFARFICGLKARDRKSSNVQTKQWIKINESHISQGKQSDLDAW